MVHDEAPLAHQGAQDNHSGVAAPDSLLHHGEVHLPGLQDEVEHRLPDLGLPAAGH